MADYKTIYDKAIQLGYSEADARDAASYAQSDEPGPGPDWNTIAGAVEKAQFNKQYDAEHGIKAPYVSQKFADHLKTGAVSSNIEDKINEVTPAKDAKILKGALYAEAQAPGVVDLLNGGQLPDGTKIGPNPYPGDPRTAQIEGIVIHHTGSSDLYSAMIAGQGKGTQAGTGSQYYVDRDGTIYQYAPDTAAVHGISGPSKSVRTDKGKPTAGLSNNNVLNIEVVAPDSDHFTPAQQKAVASLSAFKAAQYGISPTMIVGHGQLQGGPGGNKMPSEGVNLATYVQSYVADTGGTSALDAIAAATDNPRVIQSQVGAKGKIRSKPIDPKLESLLTAVGNEADVHFEVESGGQSPLHTASTKGVSWTGSHRHDNGMAADVKAYTIAADGSKHYLDFSVPADQEKWAQIVKLSVSGGATGIGAGLGYMGGKTVHIGYGTPGTWGDGEASANTPAWLTAAYDDGKHLPPMNVPDVATSLSVTPTADSVARIGQAYVAPLQRLDQIRADVTARQRTLDSSAQFGVRREPGTPATPQPTDFTKDTIFTNDQFMYAFGHDDATGQFSAYTGADRYDPVGDGPTSWFLSAPDVAPAVGSTVLGHTGIGLRELGHAVDAAPVPQPVAPVPMPGRPASLYDTIAAAASGATPEIAPVPMPGRPAALAGTKIVSNRPLTTAEIKQAAGDATPAPAPPASSSTAPRQTIKVGKHNYTVGDTFDQGGFHYVVTPKGIDKRRIPTGEKTVLGGIVKEMAIEAAPGVKQAIGNAAAQITTSIPSVDPKKALGDLFHFGISSIAKLGGDSHPVPPAAVGEPWKVSVLRALSTPPITVSVPTTVRTVPKFADVGWVLGNISVPKTVAQTPAVITQADTRVEQQKQRAVPVKTTLSVVDPRSGDVPETKAHAPQAKPTYSAPIKVTPSSKPTTRIETKEVPNPDYTTWVKSQSASVTKLQDIHDRQDGAIISAQTSAAPAKTITVTRSVPVAAAGAGVAGATAPTIAAMSQSEIKVIPKAIPRVSTARTDQAAVAAQAAAAAASNRQKNVVLASGKSVPVGTTGSAQGGRYTYTVQADGSVRNDQTGNVTGGSGGGGGNGIGTVWDKSTGGWVGGGQ